MNKPTSVQTPAQQRDAPRSAFMRELKKASSVWTAEKHEPLFAWQEGYAAFTVSHSHRKAVIEYIRGQAEHHLQTDFVSELKRLLARNGVEYDPKYLL